MTVLSGDAGNDTIYDSAGSDFLHGNAGADTADYSRHTGSIGVDLTSGQGFAGGTVVGSTYNGATETDVLSGFEAIVGSAFNDLLIGNATIGTKVSGGDGNDRIIGGALRDRLLGDDGDDTVLGNDGNDLITDGAGSDFMNGGAGSRDRVPFVNSTTGVSVQLGANTGLDGGTVSAAGVYIGTKETNTLFGFEEVIGSDHADIVRGRTTAPSLLDGADGDDFIFGGTSNDTLIGGAWDDVIDLVGGGDRVRFGFGDGDDTLSNFSANDVVELSGYGGQFSTEADVVAALVNGGAGAVLNFSDGSSISFDGRFAAAFLPNDFILI